MSVPLKIDAKRALLGDETNVTGIFVRAQHEDGRWENVDIAALDKPSLLAWLKSRGGDNKSSGGDLVSKKEVNRQHPGKIVRKARYLIRALRGEKSDHPWTNEECDLLVQLCELFDIDPEPGSER